MASKSELERFRLLREYGCVACREMGWYAEPDVHHLVDNGYRRLSGGHQSTIGLCPWHHRGQAPEGHTVASATFYFGPSLALSHRQFKLRYGSQRELLDKVNRELGLAVAVCSVPAKETKP